MIVVIIVAVVVALLLLVALLLRRSRDTATEVPSPGIQLEPSVLGFVEALHTCEYEDDPRYRAALARLREEPEHAAHQIEAAYRSVESDRIGVRESLLLAAGALAHPSVLPLLSEVAGQPTTGSIRHDGGRAAEESMLRMIAVDGIDAIARMGDADAADALVALAAVEDRGVQATAVVALKYTATHRGHYERLRDVLTPDRLYLLDVVRASVRDVPQIVDPRRHLLSEPSTVDTRPDPETGERRNSREPPESARVPRASGRR